MTMVQYNPINKRTEDRSYSSRSSTLIYHMPTGSSDGGSSFIPTVIKGSLPRRLLPIAPIPSFYQSCHDVWSVMTLSTDPGPVIRGRSPAADRYGATSSRTNRGFTSDHPGLRTASPIIIGAGENCRDATSRRQHDSHRPPFCRLIPRD